MRVASLFSGVGGADLGWARYGFSVAGQAESAPWRQQILRARFPRAAQYVSVEQAWPDGIQADVLYVDIPDRSTAQWWSIAAPAVRRCDASLIVVELGLTPVGAIVRDLALGGYDLQMALVEVTVEAPPLPPDAWDVRRRTLIFAGMPDVVGRLDIRETLLYVRAATKIGVALGSVEAEEQSRALPAGWTCACGEWRSGRCVCDQAERRAAVRAATSPVLTWWVARLVSSKNPAAELEMMPCKHPA